MADLSYKLAHTIWYHQATEIMTTYLDDHLVHLADHVKEAYLNLYVQMNTAIVCCDLQKHRNVQT